MTQKLFVTTALPYANGDVPHRPHDGVHPGRHLGALPAHAAAHEVHFVCADDAHGAPIMIAAEKAGKTPQEFVAEIAAGRKHYLDGFHIGFDNWHSTDAPENHELAQEIYLALRKNELIDVRTIEQFFDPVKGMFLPDRYIKGECPNCGAKDQYGDNCEVCGAVYAPTELKQPVLGADAAPRPSCAASEHFFFQLSDPRCVDFLKSWTQDGKLQPEVANKIKRVVRRGRRRQGEARRLGHQPRRALLRHRDPRRAGQVLLRLARRAGRLPGVAEEPASTQARRRLRRLPGRPRRCEQVHFIGKDIVTFHTLFWPAMLHFSGRKVPDHIFVHGFITVSGEKMSKSRGTGIAPLRYLELGHEPASGCATTSRPSSTRRVEDIDFNPDDFVARVNADLVGKYVNIASRAAGFLAKRFGGKLSADVGVEGAALLDALRAHATPMQQLYDEPRVRQGAARDHGAGRPGQRIRRPAQALGAGQAGRRSDAALHDVCTRLHRGLPPADDLPEAGAAGAGRAGRGLPAASRRCSFADAARALGAPPHRRLQAPDAARRRRSCSTQLFEAAGRQPRRTRCRAARRIAAEISIDDFAKIDLRIAKIVAAEPVEGSTSCCA